VHVRRFLPFYVTGLVFAVTMAVVPAIGGGDEGGTPSTLAGPGGGAGSATGSAGAPAGARTAAVSTAAVGGSRTSAAPAFLDTGLDGSLADEGDVGSAPAAGSVVDRRNGTDPLAGAPSSPDVDAGDLDDAPDVPEPCRVEPPSPAPSVDPVREVSGAQRTLEAATGQTLPADVGATLSPATDPVVCDAPEPPVDAPSVPLPATPVSTDSADATLPFGWLLRFVGLF
jgi:hypothetical protein